MRQNYLSKLTYFTSLALLELQMQKVSLEAGVSAKQVLVSLDAIARLLLLKLYEES